MPYQDILYEKKAGVAKITMNRPKVYNAFRALTILELVEAFYDAWDDNSVGVVVLTGAGDKAFCTGGDQKDRGDGGYSGSGGGRECGIGLRVEELHSVIRNIPKPVIAAVNGYAIGGGHVLHVLCDLTIASDRAIFGQTGPKVGSFDAGYGSAYLARIIGEKKAREIWYLCEQYSAQDAYQMGLVNKVVPHEQLMAEVDSWCEKILAKSPTAIRMLKYSFNADTAHIEGISQLSMGALSMFYDSDEAMEGRNAFVEKRPVDYRKFRK
ncbi:MAG: 1,4-dihydroxy-2-naphthoyl-CoA synthase [Desulfitobacteriaceae bacterium]|nr:1,4-dihydroxy-2-naphthoyl-CoA synthase [Desulfitobacteriaceae bacterium]MDI6913227.1 1,4-dihydroxy-2-naphthoyl-CoA synthase [Desulfitobacteriaceae bacterium]